jgi:hypothetical protein
MPKALEESGRGDQTTATASASNARASREPSTTLAPRPRRAWRRRRTRARCFMNGGVVYPVHTGIAAPLAAYVIDTGTGAPAWPHPAFRSGLRGRIRPENPPWRAARSSIPCGFSIGACPGKGILGLVGGSARRERRCCLSSRNDSANARTVCCVLLGEQGRRQARGSQAEMTPLLRYGMPFAVA